MISKPAALALAAVGAGFIVGFLIGSGTRDAVPGSVDTTLDGSTVTVRLRLGDALRSGLRSLIP